MRSRAQERWDQFLVLDLFEAVSSRGNTVSGRLKAQKLAFLLELKAQREHRALGHYRFFRYQMGPYSRDLAEDMRLLIEEQFLHSNREPTKRGVFLRDYITASLSGNAELEISREIVRRIAKEHGSKSGQDLMQMVYGMSVPVFEFGGKPRKVLDVPNFVDILDPVNTAGLTEIQPLSEDLIADIEAEFAIAPERLQSDHPSYKQAIRRALQRASA